LNSSGVFAFFANNFGFNERQTVAIMGAHTVGRALKNVRSSQRQVATILNRPLSNIAPIIP
jgi:NADH/NAD ratio-sensing transcriptional regulator Rex